MACDKIPDIIELDTYNGDYEKYEEIIYSVYLETFEWEKFIWENKPIVQKKHPEYKDKAATFWHIISSGSNEQERIPDLRRYERIAWPAFILKYCKDNCSDILMWKNTRRGKTRILLWCKTIKYVVILDERADFCVFWTAYPIKYKHVEEKFLKEYNEYKKSLKE